MKKILAIIPPIFLSVMREFISRLQQEKIQITAGYLAYVSLMSLVPLMVVMFSVMTAFPLFSDVKEGIEAFVYNNFLPTSSELIRDHLTGFVDNASKMSVVALSFLFLLALLLVSAIDKSLNHIWRVKEKRRMMTSFAMYWLVLTLGPILVSVSISLSSYMLSLMSVENVEQAQAGKAFFFLLPFLVSTFAFYFLYLAVPNKRVPMRFAFMGACAAAILFEIAKKAFAFYLLQLPSYEAIYGTLAVIPILFLWVYLSWVIVLSGAVLAVTLETLSAKTPEQS